MPNKFGFVYITRCLINDKYYVGIHTRNKKNYLGTGKLILRAISKYGLEQFVREILQYCDTHQELNEAERYWIKAFNTKVPHGYNLTDGGQGILNPSQETRKKMSENNAMRRPESRARLSLAMQGNTNTRGKLASEETKLKLRLAWAKGRKIKPCSDKARQKMAKAQKDYQLKNPRFRNNKGQYMSNDYMEVNCA